MKRNRTSGIIILGIAAMGVAVLTALFYFGGRQESESSDSASENGGPASAPQAPQPAVKRPPRTVARVPWCEPTDAAKGKAGLPTLLFKPAAPLVAADETLLRASLAPVRAAGLVAYVVRQGRADAAQASVPASGKAAPPPAVIRVFDPATRAAVWEKPWPGQRPEDWMFRAGHAALHCAGDFLRATFTTADHTGESWFHARTGAPLPPPTLDAGRAAPARIGSLPDGAEVWFGRAEVSAEKVEAAAGSLTDVAKLISARLYFGKPGAPPAREIAAEDCNESGAEGLMEFPGITPMGLIVGLVRHAPSPALPLGGAASGNERAATLFARDPAEPKNRWNVKIADPVLRVLVQGDRIVLQHGSVLEARPPVMASVEVGDGIAVVAAADGKLLYSVAGPVAPVPAHGRFVTHCGGVDLLLGSGEGAPLPDVFFAVDAATGALLWESTRTTADRFVDADARTGRVTVLADTGRGFVFDARTGRQLALLQTEDFREGDNLIRAGDTWVAASYIAAIAEEPAKEPAP